MKMILKNVIELSKSIQEQKKNVYRLAKNRNFVDPEVVHASQILDSKIVALQKILKNIRFYKI
jgi:hypothetical protein